MFPPKKIELGIDGKKILPPVSKTSKNLFKMKNLSDLIVHGEKLFKPVKSRYKIIPMAQKTAFKIEEITNNMEILNSKRSFVQLKPLKLYKTPRKPRNIFQTVVVKPSSQPIDVTTNRKFVNLCDLMNYLSIPK
jgi:hypothetical protein